GACQKGRCQEGRSQKGARQEGCCQEGACQEGSCEEGCCQEARREKACCQEGCAQEARHAAFHGCCPGRQDRAEPCRVVAVPDRRPSVISTEPLGGTLAAWPRPGGFCLCAAPRRARADATQWRHATINAITFLQIAPYARRHPSFPARDHFYA